MRRNKPGLADLKALRRQAESPVTDPDSPQPAPVRRIARKRSPFLPPSGPAGAGTPADVRAGAAPGAAAPDTPAPRHGAAGVATAPPGETPLNEADRRLFRTAMRHVDKIRDPGRVLLPPVASASPALLKERRMRAAGLDEKPAGKPASPAESQPPADPGRNDTPSSRRPQALSDAYTPASSEQDDRQYLKPGHGPDVLKDLKRGKWPIGASLDLHGSTVEDARERFERFLASCLTHDIKCVRIVHGKGHGSRNGDAVLKTAVRRWLAQIAEVIAYTECADAEGGSGAVQVLLK